MRLFFLFLTLFLCLDLTAQKGNFFASKWRNNPDQDLTLANQEYSEAKKGKVLYYLSNDEVNMYVDLKVLETLEENRILKIGLTVWIDMDDKTHKVLGIRYPIGSQYSRSRGQGVSGTVVNPATPLSQANTIELIGFTDVPATRLASDNTDNIRGSVKYDKDGELLYKLVIPLSKAPFKNSASGKGLAPFSVGIEYGAPPTFSGRGGAGGGAGTGGGSGMSGGGGGSRGGGGGGGGSRGGGGSMSGAQSTDPPVIFWMKSVQLAEKK
jgi:hypothetical protein